MSGNAGKLFIAVNTTTVGDGDSIASYLADGSGNFLTSQTIQAVRRLDVNSASEWAEDSAHTSGDYGTFIMGVRSDAGAAFGADGDYVPFSMDSSNRLRVAAAMSGTFAEDSAHIDADLGLFMLGVRQDTTAATAGASGDYSAIQTWSNGESKVVDIVNHSNLQQVVTVGALAVSLPVTALTLRKSIFIQNISTSGQVLYLGSATVTSAGATRGLLVGRGGYVQLSAGPANAIFGICTAAGGEIVVWEHK